MTGLELLRLLQAMAPVELNADVVIVNGDGNELVIDEVIYDTDSNQIELRSEDS
jgi:hypothetical protein